MPYTKLSVPIDSVFYKVDDRLQILRPLLLLRLARGSAHAARLARELGAQKQTVVATMRAFSNYGLVERSPNMYQGRRVKKYYLTPAGRRAAERVKRLIFEYALNEQYDGEREEGELDYDPVRDSRSSAEWGEEYAKPTIIYEDQ